MATVSIMGGPQSTQQQQSQPTSLTPEEIAEFERRARESQLQNEQLQRQLDLAKRPDAQEQARMDRARSEREKDLAEGRARGAEQFGEGSLGRLSDESIDNLRKNAKGFTAEEMNAFRDNSNMNNNNASQLRQLRIQQALNGVRGGQAVAQQNKMLADQNASNVANERELFLKNIDARRSGQAALMDSEKYTNEQKNREKMAQIVTEMGYGSLGAADRGAVMQAIVGKEMAAAGRQSSGGGKK